MPDLPGMPSSITCAACGFENATTSLYCQDCGLRLVAPPSAIVEEAAAAEAQPAAAPTRRKPPRILTVNRPKHARQLIVVTVRALVMAALAALIIVLLRTPSGLPKANAPLSPDTISNIRLGLNRNAQTGRPFAVPWSAEQGGLNEFVAGALAISHPNVTAILAPAGVDGFKIFVRHRFGSLQIYTTTGYRVIVRGNGIGLVRTSEAIGRLPMPSWIWPSLKLANDAVAEALTPDFEILRRATGARISERGIHVNFGAEP